MSWRASLLTVALAAAVCPTLSHAQNQDGGNDGGRQRGGDNAGGNNDGGERRQRDRGNFDPAQWQQRMMDRMKEELQVQDDEWKVIEPKLSKVMEAQRNSRVGGMGGGRRGGGGGGGGSDQAPTTKLGIAARDLRTAVASEASSPEDIDKKLTAFRTARTDAQTQLETTRKDLKDVLTAKQEAALVLAGVLE